MQSHCRQKIFVTAGICVQVQIWFTGINIIKEPVLQCSVSLSLLINRNVAVEFNESMGPPLQSGHPHNSALLCFAVL